MRKIEKRKLYNYRTIRYFLGTNSDEFLNVGILLIDENKKELLFIKDEHLNNLNVILKSSTIKNIADSINKLNTSNIESWYGNYLKFSEIKSHRSSKDFNTILNVLYHDYIGYKFEENEDIK